MSDRVRSELPAPLARRLGAPVLFLLVQAFIASALYFSLGLVGARVGGWTWVVFGAAAVFFVMTALSYVEGASLHQERGGATVIARYAFNELWSFIAGWAILLDYVILVALTGFIATDYAGVLWGGFNQGVAELTLAGALVVAVAVANVRGFGPERFERLAWATLADLLVQLTIVVLGLALLLEPDVLSDPAVAGGDVEAKDLAFAFTLAIVAFTGLDASSGFAGQVAVSRAGLRRLMSARFVGVLVPYVGVTIVASSALSRGADLKPESAMLGVVGAFEQEWLRETLRYVVGLSACVVLAVACTAAMLGLSRLGYSLALNRQIPSAIGRLHPRHSTPFVIIAIATLLALALIAPTDIEFLAGLYAFGATIAFTLVHLSVCALRLREPGRDRPFKMPLNLRLGDYELPVLAALGALVSIAAFGAVLWLHEEARIVGSAWMAFGLALYVVYRRSQGKYLTRRVTVPETTLTRSGRPTAQYGSILVPILGTPLDDDIMQTAGRLAAEERADEEEEGAQIEAMWVFEVPLESPLDGRLPDGELKRARAALAHAKAVGEEYEGVTVSPFTTRARKAGQAIVREARRRGVEAIVMPAEEPTRIRGGVLLGGKAGLHDTFVGETTRYVVTKAPCRVILTAPPDPARAQEPAEDPTTSRRRAAERMRRAAQTATRRGPRGRSPE